MSDSRTYARTTREADRRHTLKPHRPAGASPIRQDAGLTPTQQMILRLQRTAGNAAVNALLQEYQRVRETGQATGPHVAQRAVKPVPLRTSTTAGGAQATVQRWPTTTPTLDWSQTQSITPIMSGQPVLFFRDQTDPPVVVKAEDAPVGLTWMNALMHSQVHGTATIATRDGTGDKNTILNLINDPAKTSGQTWTDLGNAKDTPTTDLISKTDFPQANPADRARAFIHTQFAAKPKVQVMAVAQGESGRKLAHQDVNATDDNPSRIRQLFDDPAYVTKLGQLTAADLFVENADRVMGNFGNWMTNANNAITLIDNMDATSQGLWASADLIGPKNWLDKLAPSKQEQTVKSLVSWLTNEVRNGIKGGDAGIKAWLKEQVGSETREAMIKARLAQGLAQGRAQIIKLYATGKMSKAGRQAKQAAKAAYKMDVKAGDQQAGGVSYWERLKARARYLQQLQ